MVDKRFHREGGGSFDGRLYFLYLKFTFIALHLQKKKLEGGCPNSKKKKTLEGRGVPKFSVTPRPHTILNGTALKVIVIKVMSNRKGSNQYTVNYVKHG